MFLAEKKHAHRWQHVCQRIERFQRTALVSQGAISGENRVAVRRGIDEPIQPLQNIVGRLTQCNRKIAQVIGDLECLEVVKRLTQRFTVWRNCHHHIGQIRRMQMAASARQHIERRHQR